MFLNVELSIDRPRPEEFFLGGEEQLEKEKHLICNKHFTQNAASLELEKAKTRNENWSSFQCQQIVHGPVFGLN